MASTNHIEPIHATEKTIPDRRLTNEHEAADTLGLSVTTLRRWRWAGIGPRYVKLGSAVRYDPADLEAYIEQNRRVSTAG